MARRSPPVETFDIRANVAADFARPPMDDGALARAAGNLFAAIGGTLSKLVGQAEQKKLAADVEQAGQQGAVDAAEAVGLPGAAPQGDAAAGGDALSLIRGFEGFRDKPYWDVNAHRAGYGSDTVTMADGRVAKVTPGMSVSRDDAERDLARRSAEFAAGAAKAVGAEAWAALPETARNGLISVAYNYGSLPKRVVAAVRSGDVQQIAQAVRGLSGDNGGVNARRRNAEAEVIAGKGSGAKDIPGKSGPLDVTLPDIRPLQLRASGTPQDEAYNDALIKTGSFRAKASMQGGLAMLEEKFADDPQGFEKEAAKLQKAYVGAFANVPELSAVADAEFMLNYEPVRRQIYAKRDARAETDLREAAATTVETQGALLEKQAYSIGVQADGDRQLSALTARAFNVIDAAHGQGAISRAEVSRQREAVLNRLVTARLDGVFDALKSPAEKQAFAEGLKDDWVEDGPLGQLPRDDFLRLQNRYALLARQAAEGHDAESRLEKVKFSRLIDDDLASMAATGQGVKVGGLDLQPPEIARVLGEDQALKWREARGQAEKLFRATDGLAKLTQDQIEARLSGLEPKAGAEGFANAQDVYAKAWKAADTVLKQRLEDPALAVDLAMPQLADDGLRKDPAKLVEARLDAQAALDIPELARQPLTNSEAGKLAQRLMLFEDDEQQLMAQMTGLMTETAKTYGANADEVMGQVLRVMGVSRERARLGAALMRSMGLGQPPQRADLKAMDGAGRRDAAAAAMAGDAPKPKPAGAPNRMDAFRQQQGPAKPKRTVPNAKQVDMLRANRDLAEAFDQKFGKGAAAQFLQNGAGDKTTRRLPDGSVEFLYEDGWIETIHPDGSVDGRQGP